MRVLRMNFRFIKITLLVLFIFMELYLIFIKKHYALDIDVYPNTHPTPHVYKDNTVGQTFIAQRNNLSRIDMMLGTHDRINDRNVIFELWEMDPKKTPVAQSVFNASSVRNSLFHPIKFRSIKDSKDKKYYFLLHSPDSTFENSISVWMNQRDIYRYGDYLFRNTISRGDLVFRVYSKRPIYTELGRIVRNYSGIFGSKPFLIFAILFFVVIQILFLAKLLDMVYKTIKSPDADEKRD